VTEPVKSLGVSLAEDEKGRGAAELQVGDARYVLDRDQVDYLIHALIRMGGPSSSTTQRRRAEFR